MSKSNGIIERLGVVIPTLGTRVSYLNETVASLNFADPRPYIVLAGPESKAAEDLLDSGMVDKVEFDLETVPVATKIHESFLRMPNRVEFLTWIGDDDLFYSAGYEDAMDRLAFNEMAVLAYGDCKYIDSNGRKIFINRPGWLAEKILSWGPQLISQPSSVYRRDAYMASGGLSGAYSHAFDFDLFLKLRKLGAFEYTPALMSAWRWHPDSMTVKKRWVSVTDASRARFENAILPKWVLLVTDVPVRFGTYLAGKMLTLRMKLRSSH